VPLTPLVYSLLLHMRCFLPCQGDTSKLSARWSGIFLPPDSATCTPLPPQSPRPSRFALLQCRGAALTSIRQRPPAGLWPVCPGRLPPKRRVGRGKGRATCLGQDGADDRRHPSRGHGEREGQQLRQMMPWLNQSSSQPMKQAASKRHNEQERQRQPDCSGTTIARSDGMIPCA